MTETLNDTRTDATIDAVVDADRQIGLVGLAVMGENLAMNIAHHGFPISVTNRTTSRTEHFLAERGTDAGIIGTVSLETLVATLARPRRVLLMVKAGTPVDDVLTELAPYLEEDDIIIDGGNSFYLDTERRGAALAERGLRYVGMGVSGGEEGALHGPSLMPGGPRSAYDVLEPLLTAIAAKTEAGPCVTYIGPGGSGHYVKMVHNGIEYGDMQLIAETYDLMQHALGLSAPEMSEIFAGWNKGRLESYLIEVTAAVLAEIDPETGRHLVDLILDQAEQKGTGRWTSESALELGTPTPTIDAAVTARSLSSNKMGRLEASKILHGPNGDASSLNLDRTHVLKALEDALLFSKISSYAQGMALLRAASIAYEYDLNLAEIARIWKGGCIIRAKLLDPIREAYAAQPDLSSLLLAPHIAEIVNATAAGAREAITVARRLGLPCPALSASLDYFDTFRAARLPANLVQAQRDYFGAHTYQRLDREGIFHTEWVSQETP